MARYQSTFDIQAPAGRVWQVLTAFDRYGEWNPQIPRAEGTAEEGARFTLRLALPGRPAMDLVFAPLFLLIMGGPIKRSQQALNDALRRRAEGARASRMIDVVVLDSGGLDHNQ